MSFWPSLGRLSPLDAPNSVPKRARIIPTLLPVFNQFIGLTPAFLVNGSSVPIRKVAVVISRPHAKLTARLGKSRKFKTVRERERACVCVCVKCMCIHV